MLDAISSTLSVVARDGRDHTTAQRFVRNLLPPVDRALLLDRGFLMASSASG